MPGIDNKNTESDIHLILGDVFLNRGYHTKAYRSFFTAYHISTELRDTLKLVKSSLGISEVYLRAGLFDSSITILNQLSQLKTVQQSSALGIRVNNLYAENYIQKGEYD